MSYSYYYSIIEHITESLLCDLAYYRNLDSRSSTPKHPILIWMKRNNLLFHYLARSIIIGKNQSWFDMMFANTIK